VPLETFCASALYAFIVELNWFLACSEVGEVSRQQLWIATLLHFTTLGHESQMSRGWILRWTKTKLVDERRTTKNSHGVIDDKVTVTDCHHVYKGCPQRGQNGRYMTDVWPGRREVYRGLTIGPGRVLGKLKLQTRLSLCYLPSPRFSLVQRLGLQVGERLHFLT